VVALIDLLPLVYAEIYPSFLLKLATFPVPWYMEAIYILYLHAFMPLPLPPSLPPSLPPLSLSLPLPLSLLTCFLRIYS